MPLNPGLTRGLIRPLLRSLIRAGGVGAGVDDLLIDDTGDHYLIDDASNDVRLIED